MAVNNVLILKAELRLLKLKALRRGVWFKALSRLDRALIDLTIRVADKVRSSRLAEALERVVGKVKNVLRDGFVEAVFKFGLPLARRFSLIAQDWGNPYAESWSSDLSFARFLAVMYMNGMFKTEALFKTRG
ncbi:MAG: hypothetical protein QW717_00860 [Candidatus Bathyarchaeia archaeon]